MKKGYIKHYRADLEHLRGLSDPEYRYYQVSLLLAIWDAKNKQQGTFDARTSTIKEHLDWSMGKINQIKNSLIKKGYYSKTKNLRLMISNASLIFGTSRKSETIIRNSEKNFHLAESNFQLDESVLNAFFVKREEEPIKRLPESLKPSFLRKPPNS